MLIENDVNGILIGVNNQEALVEAMLRVAGDCSVSERYRKNAMDVRRKYHVEKIADEWEQVINE